jgi:hypothetical protein
MSQKRALPSWVATAVFLTKSARLGGVGTGTPIRVLGEAAHAGAQRKATPMRAMPNRSIVFRIVFLSILRSLLFLKISFSTHSGI